MANKYLLATILVFANLLGAIAQEESKYLKGAVPEVDGKILITREVKVPTRISQSQLFTNLEEWANKEFVPAVQEKSNKEPEEKSTKRVLLVRSDENYIVCQGDDFLIFKSNMFVLDRAQLFYQLVLRAENGKCVMQFRNIKYDYQDYKEHMPAEELISDKYALNKEGTKLSRYYDKFRTNTIDHIDNLAANLTAFLNSKFIDMQSATVETPVQNPAVTPAPSSPTSSQVVAPATMTGYRKMDASELSENIINMFKDNWAIVTTNEGGESTMLRAAWSGIASLGGKSTAMVLVDSENKALDTYTISFYTPIHKAELDKLEKGQQPNLTPIVTPSGATAYSEAWIVIECKKTLDQPATNALIESAQSKLWSAKDLDKLIMGEIINIWAR